MSRLRIATQGRARRWLFLAAVSISNLGCSLLFVKEPSEPRPRDCTSSSFAPVLDSVFAGYQVFRTGAALSADDEVYQDAALNRSADVALGIGFTTLFVASAAYGFVTTSKCDKFKRGERPEEEDGPDPWTQGDAADPVFRTTNSTYGGRGRAPASLAPASSPSASAPAAAPASSSAPPAAPAANAPAAPSATVQTPPAPTPAAPDAPAAPATDDTPQ